MTKHEEMKIMKESVLEAIKCGAVKMKPRWRFVLEAALYATGVFLIFLAVVYLVSFIFFMMHQGGLWFIPAFGLRGWIAFFQSMPWLLIGFSLIFIIILEVLVSKYSFAYRRPFLYSALGIIVFSFIFGGIISPFHGTMSKSMKEGHVPIAETFYRSFDTQGFQGVYKGKVIHFVPDGFVLHDVMRGTTTIYLSSSTRLPMGANFGPGDMVVIMGEDGYGGGMIHAYGVRKIGN